MQNMMDIKEVLLQQFTMILVISLEIYLKMLSLEKELFLDTVPEN